MAAVSNGASASVSMSSLLLKVMEIKPFRAGQKSWALVLSPCTSSQVRVTASTHRASSSYTNWDQNIRRVQNWEHLVLIAYISPNWTETHLWQHCLHEAEYRQHQVAGQQRQGLHTAAQSSLEHPGGPGELF